MRAQTAEDPSLRRAIEAYDAGRLDTALDLLQAVPPTLPARDQAVRYLYEGLIHLADANEARARVSFLRAVNLDPTARLDPAVHAPGRLRVFNAVREEAITDWRRLALEAEARSDTLEARRQWESVLAAFPEDVQAAAGLARLSPAPPSPVVTAPDSAVVEEPPAEAATPPVATRRYSPGQAMLLGLVVPGMGEVYAGRTLRGLFVLGVAVGAAATGMLVERVSVDCLTVPVDGFCPEDQIADERVERPYMMAGLGAAAAITVLGAIDAYFGARSANARFTGLGATLDRLGVQLAADHVRLNLVRLRF